MQIKDEQVCVHTEFLSDMRSKVVMNFFWFVLFSPLHCCHVHQDQVSGKLPHLLNAPEKFLPLAGVPCV